MRYPGSMRLHAGGQENASAWQAENNDEDCNPQGEPTSILVYRDVSASRSSRSNQDHNRVNGNLKPSLLIDSVVTNPEPYNFFLRSHIAVQGTAQPAHYHVLRDEVDLGSNIPELTLALCTTSGPATKSVSYAAPAYVADRLCERGRVYLRSWTQDEIKLPDFTHSQIKDKECNPLSNEEFKEWKKEALRLARTPNIWGKYRYSSPVSNDKIVDGKSYFKHKVLPANRTSANASIA
ncbi:Piwi-domain-containing protein [Macroventuria anomochaeta]|uniref:Piwi-domain-containing protein n=1 Tax=Macroventuria anomochaeta TaxID=301207 RepID=A0ACB6S4W6_9PLEO|nr:Piwi-domain-containing protein [Macroventuria anomochaeta]KAF2628557.1 Piwi-domain-containing protein [Macroventuria anomochaeta]